MRHFERNLIRVPLALVLVLVIWEVWQLPGQIASLYKKLNSIADNLDKLSWNAAVSSWNAAKVSEQAADPKTGLMASFRSVNRLVDSASHPQTGIMAQWKTLESDTKSEVFQLRVDLLGEIGKVRQSADDRIGDSLKRLDSSLGKIDDALKLVDQLRKDLNPGIQSLNSFLAQVNEAAPDFLDCYADGFGNPNCLFNRYTSIALAAEPALKQFPNLVSQVTGISTDVHTVTTRFAGPRTWKSKLWEGIKLGVYAGSRAIP